MRWLVVLVFGAALGVAVGMADSASTLPTSSPLRAVAILANVGSVWAAAAMLGGWVLSQRPWSVVAGPLVLLAALTSYHVWLHFYPAKEFLAYPRVSGSTGLWVLTALAMGPLLGLLGGMARMGDIVGTVCRLAVPVGLLVEVGVRFKLRGGDFELDPTRAWTLTILFVVGGLGLLLALAGQDRSRA